MQEQLLVDCIEDYYKKLAVVREGWQTFYVDVALQEGTCLRHQSSCGTV